MNGIFNFVRFVTYSVSALVIRKSWNWLTADVEPIPGKQLFEDVFYHPK